MDDNAPIILAHERAFSLGRLHVHPATRELAHADGRRETIEPRVMQVLVALARAEGAVLTRDELTRSCWEGRIVGEDAINRVLSRLRRAADGIGAGAFRVETLTKVGYRLVAAPVGGGGAAPPSPAPNAAIAPARRSRRGVLIAGGAALGVAAAGGLGYGLLRHRPDGAMPTPQVAVLLEQARDASGQGSVDGAAQARGLVRQVVEIAPTYADGWGLLAIGEASNAHMAAPSEAGRSLAYAREAIRKATALDPGNSYAALAAAMLPGAPGPRYIAYERALWNALARHPEDTTLGYNRATFLTNFGRNREAAATFERYLAVRNPGPGIAYIYGQILWACDRLDDADRWIERIYSAYPRHYGVWFTRFYYFMYTGRCDQALAMARDLDTRPTGIPDGEFDLVIRVATAMKTRALADVDSVMQAVMAAARSATGRAENAMQFASALGRLDECYQVAEAYYFGRGFQVGEIRFSRQQGGRTTLADRRTWFLFVPSTAAMRADPRFAGLVREIGLEEYWRASGVAPDFRSRS